MTAKDLGGDPRLEATSDPDIEIDHEHTVQVGRSTAGGPGKVIAVCVFTVLAVGLFVALNARRTQAPTASLVTPASGAVAAAPEPPLQLPVAPIAFQPPTSPQSLVAGTQAVPTPVAQPAYAPPPVTRAFMSVPPSAPAVDPNVRRRAPTVVVDLAPNAAPRPGVAAAPVPFAAGASAQVGQTAGVQAGPVATDAELLAQAAGALLGAPAAAAGGGERGPQLNGDEAFAARVSGGDGPDRAMASAMRNIGAVVPQGAIIPAVLETAINSDLPGYTRAVVSRDVRSFDGKSVLIPRGSRLIGQYKSAVSQGQSRAFIIWTRVTRPDGVSVQVGSPGTDALGRGGLEGEVDRHFFGRFGGSILLSVLNAGVAAIGGQPATQISIGSPGAAASAAATALQGADIPPTIKVAQGEAIRIFVARDLDFSNIGPVR